MMRIKLKKVSAVIVSMLLVCFIAAVSVFSAGAVEPKKGSIEVELNPEFAGLPMTVITLGDYKNGNIELYDEFSQFDIKPSDFSQNNILRDKLNALRDYVYENDVDGEVRMIGYDGSAYFNDLYADKLYLIMQPVITDIIDISPALAFIPAPDPEGNILYDIKVAPKPREPEGGIKKGAVIVNKVDNNNEPLKGAVFSLWRKNAYTDDTDLPKDPDSYELGEDDLGRYYWSRHPYQLVTNENGQAFMDQLLTGFDYRIIEEEAPEGYELDKTPHEFTITEKASVVLENGKYVFVDGEGPIITVENIPTPGTGDVSSSEPEESSEPEGSTKTFSDPSTPSYPTPSKVTTTTATTVITPNDGKVVVEITGDDIVKYIVIPAAVAASLILVIVLVIAGGKKKDNDDN